MTYPSEQRHPRYTATKAHAGGAAAAVVALVAWMVGEMFPEMPREVQIAAGTVAVFAGGWIGIYFTPNREKAEKTP